MKEFLTTGMVIAALFGMQSTGPLHETNHPPTVEHDVSEGFIPHQQVTMPPVQTSMPNDGLLPDYGSEAYL